MPRFLVLRRDGTVRTEQIRHGYLFPVRRLPEPLPSFFVIGFAHNPADSFLLGFLQERWIEPDRCMTTVRVAPPTSMVSSITASPLPTDVHR